MHKTGFWAAKALIGAALLGLLSACGGGGSYPQDGSSASAKPATGSVSVAPPTAVGPTNVSGSVGDGPVIDAHIAARDNTGALIAETTSDSQARFRLAIPESAKYPVTITSSGGTDVISGVSPEFDMKSVLNDATQAIANVTPITTLIVRSANCRAGGLTNQNIKAARAAVSEQMSAGLDPAKVPDPIATAVTNDNVAENVKANQVLAEILTRTTSTLQRKGRTITAAEVLEALACDVADDLFDGSAPSGGISEVSNVAQAATAAVLTEAIVNQLQVGGKEAHAALDAAIHRVAPDAPDTVNTDAVEISVQVVAEARKALAAAIPLQPDAALVSLAQSLENYTTPLKPSDLAATLQTDAAPSAGALTAAAQAAPDATIASVGTILHVRTSSPAAPPSLALAAGAAELASGATTSITWEASRANSCVGIRGLSGSLPTSGTRATAPITRATAFTITCLNATGSVTKSVIVNLPTPTVTVIADKPSVNRGESTTLHWSTNRVTSCTAGGSWSGTRALSGSAVVGPITADSRFTLTCTDGKAAVSQAAIVRIAAPTLSLAANTLTVGLGGAPTLKWSTLNVDSCTASDGWSGDQGLSGQAALRGITTNTNYTLTCSGPAGQIAKSVTVGIAAPTLALASASPSIDVGSSASLSWHATNATACTASGGWSGARPIDGTNVAVAGLKTKATLSLTCTGPGGSVARSVDIQIGVPTVTLTADRTSINAGESVSLSWTSHNATGCTASGAWTGAKTAASSQTISGIATSATYSLQCAGSGGVSALSSVTVSVRPSVTLTASAATVAPNSSVTLTWNAVGGGACIASSPDTKFSGPISATGSVVTSPIPGSRTFTVSCTNAGVAAIASTTVTTGNATIVQWVAPSTMSDGSQIQALHGFNVYYGNASRQYGQVIEVLDPRATQLALPLSSGTWFVTVTAIAEILDNANNIQLRESAYGDEAQKVVP